MVGTKFLCDKRINEKNVQRRWELNGRHQQINTRYGAKKNYYK
jgi:hypothetical protein